MKTITIICLAAGVMALPVIPVQQSEAINEKRQDPVLALEAIATAPLVGVALAEYLIGPDQEFRKRETEASPVQAEQPEALNEKRQDPVLALEAIATAPLVGVALAEYLIGPDQEFRKRQSEESPNLPIIYDLPTPVELLTGFKATVACFTGENCLS